MTKPIAIAILLAVALAACGGSDSGEGSDFTCAIGELTGAWRLSYVELDGSCGPIPDETFIAPPGGAGDPACVVDYNSISADKCQLETDVTCPTLDNLGTQTWVWSIRQTGSGLLEGSATLQLNHTSGICRGTYDMTMSQL